MEAFLISTAIVTLAEIGDKTQLLSFILAARFRTHWPIILGIFVATLFNHALAAVLGGWITSLIGADTLRWLLGLSFIAISVWVLIPDKLDDAGPALTRYGVFGTTLVTFFIAEIGDKTQIATVALAAQYQMLVAVVIGTTLGMMIANVPAVMLGDRIAGRLPLKAIRMIAAAIFFVLGIATLAGAAGQFGI